MAPRTSRRRRTSRSASHAGKIHSSLRSNRSGVGKNRLNYKHVHAKLYRGSNRVFKGRIALDRGIGMVEFPTYDQFRTIAKHEGVPKELVDRAFGHLYVPKPRRRTSKKKRRRTSKGGFLSRLFKNPLPPDLMAISREMAAITRKAEKRVPEGNAATPFASDWMTREERARIDELEREWRRHPYNATLDARRRKLSNNPAAPSAGKRIARGGIAASHTIRGKERMLAAAEIEIPPSEAPEFGSDVGIMVNRDGEITVARVEDAYQLMKPWVTHKQFSRAFGHLLRGGKIAPPALERAPIPTRFGPRSMRLGHREKEGEGDAKTVIIKGQLVLYHKPSGAIVWQAYDDSEHYPEKPIWIWFGAHKGHFTLAKAVSGAKLGRGVSREDVSAEGRGIPPMAMLEAFDYLLPKDARRTAYQAFAGIGAKKR